MDQQKSLLPSGPWEIGLGPAFLASVLKHVMAAHHDDDGDHRNCCCRCHHAFMFTAVLTLRVRTYRNVIITAITFVVTASIIIDVIVEGASNFTMTMSMRLAKQRHTVNSLDNGCFGYQAICPYIKLSLLRETTAVRIQ